MAESDGLGRGGHGKMSDVHARLPSTHDGNTAILTKLSSTLESRRVKNSGNILDALDVRDDWVDVDPTAHSDGVT